MFIFSHKNQSKALVAHSTILLLSIVLIASCAPQVPIAVTSTSTGQPQLKATVAVTPTLGIGSTQVSPKDNMTMVFVPAGEFEMGGENDDPSSFPVHTVYLDAFWIDQTEVTNEIFAKFVESTGYMTDAEKAGSSNDFRTADQTVIWEKVTGLAWNRPDGENSSISGLEDHPVVHVSWNDANAYCTWAGRRLPTEAEWEKAASWNYVTGEKYRYPWGDEFDQSLANFCDVNCAYDFATKYLDDGYAETSPVGSFPNGASPYGALDMSGNVLEWVADWYEEDFYEHSPASNPLGPDSGQQRISRGGAWATNDFYVSSARRFAWDHPFQQRALGFRCALGTSPFGSATQTAFATETSAFPNEITDPKGVVMRFVPAGEFTMGSDEANHPDNRDEQPAHQVYLDAFYIDKYEVTNKLYKACVDEGFCQLPVGLGSFTRSSYYDNSQFDDYPVMNVRWDMAMTYCEWRGARLPTEAQWEKAARGTDARTYPWGKGIDCSKARYQGGCKDDTAQVGSHEGGVSPYGVYDMAGNVMEWVADWYSETYYQNSPASNPFGPDSGSGENRVLRGGSWISVENDVRSAARNWPWGSFGGPAASVEIGFRCALRISP